MDILSYLASLIQTNNEVGVPGLGTFVKKKSPGRYDAGLHAFLPPSYQLAFDPEVRETGLLAEYVSKQHNLSDASANYHIEQFVAKVKQELEEQLEAAIDPLGRLLLSGRLITFLPNEELSLGHQFFGLPTVTEAQATQVEAVAPTIAEVRPVEEEVVSTSEPVIIAEEEVIPIEEPIVVEETPTEEQEKLEAIVMENNIEEENPGQLPEEPIYFAEPAELVDEPELEEQAVVEAPPVVEEYEETEASVAAVTPVEETPLAEVPPVFEEPTVKDQPVVEETPLAEVPPVFEEATVKDQPVVEEPPFVETPPVVESPMVAPPFAAEEKPATAIKMPEAVIPLVTGATIVPEETVNYQIEEQPKQTTPGYYKIVIGVLLLLCLAFGFYMLNPDWFRKTNTETAAPEPNTVPLEEKPTVVLPDTLDNEPDSLKQDRIQVDTTEAKVSPVAKKPAAEKPVAVIPARPKIISYEVIASSVYGDKAAQQFITSMKQKWGIKAKIVSKLPGKKIKISVASFKDEKKARLERARLEEKLNIPGLYIYTNTNKPD
ncbi:nucleoid DNA-binding protein [Pedobacter sp. CAN_A7]|uniref:HU domain-containing protein n=1 Tax=Pedobacter sp. CAN_A7 TaxID=2787722 RepID=UPI0018CA545A